MPATPTPAPVAGNNVVELLMTEIKDMKRIMEDERKDMKRTMEDERRAREHSDKFGRLEAQMQNLTRNYQDGRRTQDRAVHGNQFPEPLPVSSRSRARSPSPERSVRGRSTRRSDSHAPRPPLPTGGHSAASHSRHNGGVQKTKPKGKSLWDRTDPHSRSMPTPA
jgi:hypothetical protein